LSQKSSQMASEKYPFSRDRDQRRKASPRGISPTGVTALVNREILDEEIDHNSAPRVS